MTETGGEASRRHGRDAGQGPNLLLDRHQEATLPKGAGLSELVCPRPRLPCPDVCLFLSPLSQFLAPSPTVLAPDQEVKNLLLTPASCGPEALLPRSQPCKICTLPSSVPLPTWPGFLPAWPGS